MKPTVTETEQAHADCITALPSIERTRNILTKFYTDLTFPTFMEEPIPADKFPGAQYYSSS